MKRNIFIVLFLSLTIVSVNTYACRCQVEATVPENYKTSDIVFSGKVISIKTTFNYDSIKVLIKGKEDVISNNWNNTPISVVKIKVDKIYKGKR